MDRTRRTLCQAGLALGCVAALPACGGSSNKADGGSGATCDVGDVGVGNASDTPLNSATNVPVSNANGMSLFICHDAGGYYAVDAGCTHLGCDVTLKSSSDLSQGFLCPCHQATYDANGLNPTAPAPSPLLHYALCAEPSGALVCKVSPTDAVPATTRLKV